MSDNTICWTDIPVENLDRAIDFYSAVLGQPVAKQSEMGFEYGLLPHEGDNMSGCLVKQDDNKPSKQGPLIYLNVNGRLDDAISTANEQGGEIIQPKHSIGPYGFRAIIIDSEGNRVALHSQA